jgi:uncharacterized protein
MKKLTFLFTILMAVFSLLILSCTSITGAARDGNVSAIKRALENGAKIEQRTPDSGDIFIRSCTPIMLAAYYRHPNAVRYLLKRGANVNAKTSSKHTPLMYACMNNQYHPLQKYPINQEIIKLLIARGANVNAEDHGGDTALYYASYAGSLWAVKMLVKSGARINNPRGIASQPVFAAGDHGFWDIVRFLESKGSTKWVVVKQRHDEFMANMHSQSSTGRPKDDSERKRREEIDRRQRENDKKIYQIESRARGY